MNEWDIFSKWFREPLLILYLRCLFSVPKNFYIIWNESFFLLLFFFYYRTILFVLFHSIIIQLHISFILCEVTNFQVFFSPEDRCWLLKNNFLVSQYILAYELDKLYKHFKSLFRISIFFFFFNWNSFNCQAIFFLFSVFFWSGVNYHF